MKDRQKINATARALLTATRKFVSAYKLERGCSKCGYAAHAVALDFHHVRGVKKYSVAKAYNIPSALAEIAKCEILCANCHRIETHKSK